MKTLMRTFIHLISSRTIGLLVALLLPATVDCRADTELSTRAASETVLIADGRGQAMVVTAEVPNPIVALAVEELVEHIKLATGVVLPVVTETAAANRPERVRVYVGETTTARAAGLNTAALENDGFYLRVDQDTVYVLGAENTEAYNERSGRNGTLYGVYELLERAIGVRWLWPGELGTHAPRRDRVTVAAADEVERPALKGRYYWINHIDNAVKDYRPETERLAFSPEGLNNYQRDLHIFLRRHRMGFSESRSLMTTGHVFTGWWERYGEQHPEWFMMNAAGDRVGPTLCVSNPELARYIVDSERTVLEESGVKNFMLGEADERAYCHCAECMAWDEPLPKNWPAKGESRSTSNRYARFAERIRDLVRKKYADNDFRVTFFIYFNYLHKPTIDLDLTGTNGVFCPWFSGFNPWYPMLKEGHQRLLDTWSGWSKTGAAMHYRPNYLLTGYVMPHLSTWQTGEMFRHVVANGARSVEFDSLWAQWAVKGPMYYLHMRLTTDPTREVADIRREYFDSFGPAAKSVEAYFDYWEAYSEKEAPGGGVARTGPDRARQLYPKAAFGPAQNLLAKARKAVQRDPDSVYDDRVRFLEVGLRHAELAAEFIGTLEGGRRAPVENKKQFAAARKALEELIAFRREHESLYFADLIAAAYSENRGLQIEELFDKGFAVQQNGSANRMEEPWEEWFFRPDLQEQGVAGKWYAVGAPESGIKSFDEGTGQEFDLDHVRWTPVRVPARLDETPIGDYSGYGWYATTFIAPKEIVGKSAVLRFEGVDEQAWIYVNGRYIGEHTVKSENKPVSELWEKPFMITVPAGVIRANGKNLLVVRMHSGTGAAGIWREVKVGLK